MKRQVAFLIAALTASSVNFISAKNEQLVSFDSLHVMQESREGKALAESLKGKITEYQNFVRNSQQELTNMQEEVTKKADMLSKDALQEKTDKLNLKKKELERVLADREETLKAELQREQMKLRDKQLAVINNMSEEQQWGMVVDKNTPGVLFVNKSIDKTNDLLKRVDEAYASQNNKQSNKNVVVANNKPAVVKTETKKA